MDDAAKTTILEFDYLAARSARMLPKGEHAGQCAGPGRRPSLANPLSKGFGRLRVISHDSRAPASEKYATFLWAHPRAYRPACKRIRRPARAHAARFARDPSALLRQDFGWARCALRRYARFPGQIEAGQSSRDEARRHSAELSDRDR